MQEIENNWKSRRVYRCEGTLQAGTSVMEVKEPFLHENIRNHFLNPSYILSGTGYYIDETGRRFRYGPGMLLLRLPGILHHQFHEPGATYVDKYFAIPAPFYATLFERKMLTPERPLIDFGMHSWLADRFDALADELESQSEDRLILTMGNFFQFLCELLLTESEHKAHYSEIVAGAALLKRDPERRINIADVAGKVGMTAPNFRRLFTLYLNISPAEYRIRKRIEQIQSLLKTTDLPLKEIAERFGYADIYTFSRQFRQYTGCPPGEFRKS